MRILKKSLACLLVAIIAATAMFGCLVSADTATYEGWLYATDVTVVDGSSEDVTFEIKLNNGAIYDEEGNETLIYADAANLDIALNFAGTISEDITIVDFSEGATLGDLGINIDNEKDTASILVETNNMNGTGAWNYVTIAITVKPDVAFAYGSEYTLTATANEINGATYEEEGITYGTTTAYVNVLGGTEANPHQVVDSAEMWDNNFQLVGETTYFTLPEVTGKIFYIYSNGAAFTVNYNGVAYPSAADNTGAQAVTIDALADGVLTMTVDGTVDEYVSVRVKNPPVAGTSALYAVIENEGTFDANVTEDMFATNPMGMAVPDGYYYTYTAPDAGTVTVTMNQDSGWSYVVNNITAGTYGDEMAAVAGSAATYTVEVAKDDVLNIRVSPVDENGWAIFGSVNWTLDFAAAVTEPEVDSNLVVAGAAVGFGTSSLQVNFRIRKTVIALYDKVELVIIPDKYDLTTLNLVETPAEIVPELTLNGNFYTYAYTDIQLYELGLDIDYMLRAYDAEGNLVAVSETKTTSAASYLKNAFAASSDAKFRTLVVDTLVVGAEAVENTAANYEGSDLDNATSIIEGFDISEATPSVESYNTVNVFNSYDSNYGTASSSTYQVAYPVAIGKVPYMNFRIKDANSVLDATKISFRVSYTQKDASGETPYEKTFDSSNTTISRAGRFITFKFDEVGLQDGDKDLFVEIMYDGKVVCDLTYSIETYLGANTTSTIGELATALIKLGNSFRIYSNIA